MMSIRAVLFAAFAFGVLFAVVVGGTRLLLPAVWRLRAVRIALALGAAATVVGLGVWAGGSFAHARPVQRAGVHVCWDVLAFVLPLAIAVPAAGVLARLLALALDRRRAAVRAEAAKAAAGVVSRRDVIQWGAAVVPLGAIGASTTGLVSAGLAPAMPRVPMTFAALPSALDGLRILQLTDLHLGVYRTAADVERVLEAVAPHKPDLVLITGDVADELALLGPVLRLVADLAPRLGVFASPGNHEYFHRIADVRRIFDKSPVPLLLEKGVTLDAGGGARLHVAGAGDPVSLRADPREFLERSIDAALDGAPSDAFHVLMSHRPDGFLVAAERKVALTVSGHTHGGQVGAFGRSAFEPLFPNRFLRGAYARGESRLYTSAGFGHWFPFRLGCAAEAPLIELARG